ncbi:hypothetical protein ACLOJK_014454 [Asimina triloba]
MHSRGKRKSARPKLVPKKRMGKLDTVFNCPFCGYPRSVECTIDKKSWIGIVSCSFCNETYRTKANHLTEEIDIYSEWVDECEQVNERNKDSGSA